jgi:hypothetical protein
MEKMLNKLRNLVKGEVILPEDSNYDEARTIYNAMIDKHPAAILKCRETEDVIQAVKFAKKNQMVVSVKGGGHNGAGLALVNNGLVIDLSEMKDIQINPEKRIAKIQAGNMLGDVDKATHEHGLALPVGINSTTGIAGLTLGGGLGYLSRKGGLTIDNLLEAEAVLANGELVVANAGSHPDLFWALRGGGGNFGVVVSFSFNLIPVKNVYAGPMLWPMNKAEEVMRFYDKLTKDASNDLYGFFAFLIVPPGPPFPEHLHNKNMCGIVWCYTGPSEKWEKVFKPIREFGPPALDLVGELPMPALNGMFDALYPPGLQWYWKTVCLNELSDAAIQSAIEHGSTIPTMHSTTHFYPIDGKVHEVGAEETSWTNRGARWIQSIVGVDPDVSNIEIVTNWCKDYYAAMQPHASGGAYVNFMMEEGQDRIKASYGINYERLAKIKAKYDPDNFFHINQNIKPG